MNASKKRYAFIIFISWLAYLISYLGRNDYSACLLEIVTETGMERAAAGMISSTFALCNAVGQLASTAVINKVSPIKLIALEIFSVAVINLTFPVFDHFLIMMLLWGINGAMQATLLCGITRIFAENLAEPWLSRGAVSLNTIGAVGGAVNYLLAPALIRFFNWQSVFFTVSTMLFALGIAWCVIMPRITASRENTTDDIKCAKSLQSKPKSMLDILRVRGVICAILSVLVIGSLRESVSLWIPSYLNERFELPVTVSTAITALVPMLQISGALLAGRIGRRVSNLFVAALVAFLLSSACFGMISLVSGLGLVVTVVAFVINAISMTAALTFILSLYPIRCVDRGSIAKFVGILNFFVHMGDFAASTGFGWLSSIGGWNLTFSVMAMLAFFAAAVALIGIREAKKGKCDGGEDRVSCK